MLSTDDPLGTHYENPSEVFQSSQKTLKMEEQQPSYYIFYRIFSYWLWKIWIRKVIYVIFHIFYHSIFSFLVLIWQGNIRSHSPNPLLLLFGKALAAREPKDMTLLPDPDNIGEEILVLSSVALISNIGLLTSEALTGEPNDKEPTFKK